MSTYTEVPATITDVTKRPVSKAMKRPPVLRYGIGPVAKFLSVIAPKLAARWLVNLFLTPRKYKTPAREFEWMKDAKIWKLTFDADRSLPLYSWGNGPTILLVHGLSGRASQLGAFVQPLLEKGFRVVAFDAPAHGDADGKQTSLPEVAIAVQKVAETLGPLEGILAHSNGTAATTIALSRGLDAKRVVYISPPEDLSGYLHRLARFIGFNDIIADLTQSHLEKQSGFKFSAARGNALAPKMKIPALIVHDSDDKMVPFEEGENLAGAWPMAQFHATNGLGHSRILRDTAVIRRTTQFLRQGA